MAWWCEAHEGRLQDLGDPARLARWLRQLRTQAQQRGLGGCLLFDGERWLIWWAGADPAARPAAALAGDADLVVPQSYRAWAAERLPPGLWPWRCAFVDAGPLDEVMSDLSELSTGRPEDSAHFAEHVLEVLARHDAM